MQTINLKTKTISMKYMRHSHEQIEIGDHQKDPAIAIIQVRESRNAQRLVDYFAFEKEKQTELFCT